MAAEPAGGVYDDHHNFFCSLDSSSSTMLDATTVNVLTIFKWEGGGEGGVKDDGYCIDKDRDGVQSILSSTTTTTMMVSVLTSETIVNNSDSNVP